MTFLAELRDNEKFVIESVAKEFGGRGVWGRIRRMHI